MASEKGSTTDSSLPAVVRSGYVLDERRRAALAEVDNAKFSYVLPVLLGAPYLRFS